MAPPLTPEGELSKEYITKKRTIPVPNLRDECSEVDIAVILAISIIIAIPILLVFLATLI